MQFTKPPIARSDTDPGARLSERARFAAQQRPGLAASHWLLVLAPGVATTAASRSGAPDQRYLAAAEQEIAALKRDREPGRLRLRCGVHRRLYTFVRHYGQGHLTRGAFTRLQGEGLATERAAFFLDPWNSPYWIRFDCRSSPRQIIVYSPGPNRRRDSSRQAVLGDGIGTSLTR